MEFISIIVLLLIVVILGCLIVYYVINKNTDSAWNWSGTQSTTATTTTNNVPIATQATIPLVPVPSSPPVSVQQVSATGR